MKSVVLLTILVSGTAIGSEWIFDDPSFNKDGQVTIQHNGKTLEINNKQALHGLTTSNSPVVVNKIVEKKITNLKFAGFSVPLDTTTLLNPSAIDEPGKLYGGIQNADYWCNKKYPGSRTVTSLDMRDQSLQDDVISAAGTSFVHIPKRALNASTYAFYNNTFHADRIQYRTAFFYDDGTNDFMKTSESCFGYGMYPSLDRWGSRGNYLVLNRGKFFLQVCSASHEKFKVPVACGYEK